MPRPPQASPYFYLRPVHRKVLDYVRDHPGCSKLAAAEAGTQHPMQDPSKRYYLVNTLIAHGYLIAEHQGNRCTLTAWEV